MAATILMVIWLVLGVAAAVATALWGRRLWKRRKEFSLPMAALAVVSVTFAMWGSLGAVIG